MKTSVLFSVLMLCSGAASAQYGIGTNSTDPTAILEISSTSKGVLPPRMTETERLAIPSPANGLMVYQTTNSTASPSGLYVYGTFGTPSWRRTATSNQSILSSAYNAAAPTTVAANSVSTIDVNVTGAAAGNGVVVSPPAAYPVAADVYAYVPSSGVVRIVFSNGSATSADFPAGIYNIRILK